MTRSLENHDMLNDMKKLKAKGKQSYSGLAQFKRIVEKQDTDPDYQRMLVLIMGRAESHRQPNTQNELITYGNHETAWSSDSQDGLLLGQDKKPDNKTPPLCIKRKGMSDSKLKNSSRRKLCTKEKCFVEKTGIVRAGDNRCLDQHLACNDVDSVPFHREANRARSRPSQMNNARSGLDRHIMESRKGKAVVKEEREDMEPLVPFKSEKPDPKRGLLLKPAKMDKAGLTGKWGQGEKGLFLSAETEDYNAKARSSRKQMKGGITITDGAKKRFERFHDADHETDVDLKLLQDTLPSKRFCKRMEEDTKAGRIGSTSASNGFRKQILDVLRKPYDEGELKRLLEAVEDGPYYDYHPDLEEKLKSARFKRRKSLTILRGFFFWLQNVAREGAFKPWRDDECLAVKPPLPQKSP